MPAYVPLGGAHTRAEPDKQPFAGTLQEIKNGHII